MSAVDRRVQDLDTIAAVLPMERRDELAELLTDQDVETLRHLVNEGMGDDTLRALTSDLAQPISAYSHGMKQKLAIISAWLHAPKLIVMDEPFVGLDPTAAYKLKEMMRAHCDAGGAIFFSTHVLEVAEKLCDKVAIIRQGRLLESGSMEEVKGNKSLESVFLELEGDENV